MVSEPILSISVAPLQGLQRVRLGCGLQWQQGLPLFHDLLPLLLHDPFHDWERMGQHPLVHQQTLLLLDLFLSSVPGIVVVVLYPSALLLDLYPSVPA